VTKGVCCSVLQTQIMGPPVVECAHVLPSLRCFYTRLQMYFLSYLLHWLSFFAYFFSFFPLMLYHSYTLMFSLFKALLLCCFVSFCSLLDGVCLSENKRITYLLTYLRIAAILHINCRFAFIRDIGYSKKKK